MNIKTIMLLVMVAFLFACSDEPGKGNSVNVGKVANQAMAEEKQQDQNLRFEASKALIL